MKGLTAALGLFFVLFALGSCTSGRRDVEVENHSLELMERLEFYNGMVHSLDAKALVVFNDGDRNYSFRASLRADGNGSKLRLTLSDFVFKKPVISIVRNGDSFTAIMYAKKQYIQAPYEELDAEELTGFRIRKEILLSTLMGKVYVDEQNSVLTSPDPSTLIIERNDDQREIVSFDSQLLPHEIIYARGYRTYSTTFREYLLVEGVYYPRKLSVTQGDHALEANFSEVRVNGNIDPAVFQFDDEELAGLERKYLP